MVTVGIKLIAQWLLQSFPSPFLKIDTISDSPRDTEICTSLQMSQRKKANDSTRASLPTSRRVGRSSFRLDDFPRFNSRVLDSSSSSVFWGGRHGGWKGGMNWQFLMICRCENDYMCGQLNWLLKCSAQQSGLFLFTIDRSSIFVAYHFTDRNSLPTVVAYKLKQFSIITWGSCRFHFFGLFGPPVFTALPKASCNLTL